MLNYTKRNLVLNHFEDYFEIYKYQKFPQVYYQDEHHYIYKNQFILAHFNKNYYDLDLYEIQLIKGKIKKCYLVTREQFNNSDFNHILIENNFPNIKYLFAFYKNFLILNPYNKNLIADIRLKNFRDKKADEYADEYKFQLTNYNVTQQTMFLSIFKNYSND